MKYIYFYFSSKLYNFFIHCDHIFFYLFKGTYFSHLKILVCYFQQYILGFVSVDLLFLWEYVPFSWVFKLGNFVFDSGHYKCWVVETLNSIIFLQWKLFFCPSMQLFGWTQITNFGFFFGWQFCSGFSQRGRQREFRIPSLALLLFRFLFSVQWPQFLQI